MSAYIKFLEGPSKNTKVRVPLSKFKNEFKDLKFDEKKKYFVQDTDDNYVKAKIIFMERSEEELTEKINSSRPRLYPDNKLETCSEESDHTQNKRPRKSRSDLKEIQIKKEKGLKKYATLLNMKLDDLGHLINHDAVMIKDKEKPALEKKENIESQNSILFENKSVPETISTGSEQINNEVSGSVPNCTTGGTEDAIASTSNGVHTDKEAIGLNEKEDLPKDKPKKLAPKITSNISVHDAEACKKKVDRLKADVEILKEKNKDHVQKSSKLEKKYENTKKI